jgi:hypothetical protein
MRNWTQEVKQEVRISVERDVENEYRKNAQARKSKAKKEKNSQLIEQ